MAEEEMALGLQGTKRIEMGLARAEDIRHSTRKSETVMKGDFDSLSKLEIF